MWQILHTHNLTHTHTHTQWAVGNNKVARTELLLPALALDPALVPPWSWLGPAGVWLPFRLDFWFAVVTNEIPL